LLESLALRPVVKQLSKDVHKVLVAYCGAISSFLLVFKDNGAPDNISSLKRDKVPDLTSKNKTALIVPIKTLHPHIIPMSWGVFM
jgi:hypothetical protein